MLDWYFSVEENKVKRNELRNSTWFLKATSDFAAGAKHFKPRVFHDTVSKAFVTPGWFTNYFPKGASPIGSYRWSVHYLYLVQNCWRGHRQNLSFFFGYDGFRLLEE
jgi:hypothetical protein